MQITGIICEYNPIHLGHQKQISLLKAEGHAVVCLMSGNYVQRGHPAIFNKMLRAEAAVRCGADLVLELPVNYALSSAEGFAAGGVSILSQLCDHICFGAETADREALMLTARALLQTEFSEKLRAHLDAGSSFPAARQAAVADLGLDSRILETPNNILAIEYCKAILSQSSSLLPIPVYRPGSYHDTVASATDPSATAVRKLICSNMPWHNFVPDAATDIFRHAQIHSLINGEQAILYKLRTMTDNDFAALPFGSEGLWRKLMHACRENATVEEIITATKSKRYTRTRIDRMILCAFLGLTEDALYSPAPYCRVLAFNDTGRSILATHRDGRFFVNIGSDTKHPFQSIEHRCTSLYGLFSDQPELPDAEMHYRVYYLREES